VKQRQNWSLEEADDVELGEQDERYDDANDDSARNPEQAVPELLQMIQEWHLIAWSLTHAPPPASRSPFPAI
jgi:hypothetical protein